MNVFVIPSWYPDHERGLLGGVFVAEAVRALARHHPEFRLHVSRWGQSHRELSVDRLRTWLAPPTAAAVSGMARDRAATCVVEHSSPTWTWRYGFRRGNLAGVLRANRDNLARARAECGTVHLLHAHVAFPGGTVAQRLSAETGIPYIVTEHMSPFPFRFLERRGELVPEVREPLRHAARVTAVSRALAARIHARAGVEATVIPNGVDETFFTPGPPPARAAGDFTFFTVARLEPQKGIADLLQATARLDVPARFRIAGGGSLAGELRALAGSLGIAARVDWLGPLPRERVRDEMRACDAFVLTSRHESFGIVYAEALACGKPVVATRCEGPEDIVTDANGVLVPVGDVPAITAALAAFARRERAWDPVAIRADFEARFSSRVVAGRFAALYRDVAGAA